MEKSQGTTLRHNPFANEGFKISSSSNTAPYCVAVRVGELVEIRDTKNPNGPTLAFSKGEWVAFVEGVKNDEFNV